MTEKGGIERVALCVFAGIVGLAVAYHFLAYFRSPMMLGAAILIEVTLASLWHYETVYFSLMMAVFVWAGTTLPLAGPMGAARWLVLAVGAFVGAALWMRGREQSFGAIHLAALFASAAALVSAMVSGDPTDSLLKVLSVFLLFLYGSTGARLAIAGRAWLFTRGILRACEFTVYATALAYSAGWPIWGNPNSLGAVMGAAAMPVLFWGFVTAETRNEKYRMLLLVVTCAILLYVALSRASIIAAAASVVGLCICLRRQKLLVEAFFFLALLVGVAGVIEPEHFERAASSVSNELLYKNKTGQEVLTSRQSPWEETIASLKKHPWVGTGWGTSDMGSKKKVAVISLSEGIYTLEGTNREHGNSYLALAEYVGIVGLVPFGFLLFLVLRMVLMVCLWMRRTSNPAHPAVPMAMVLLACLVHAFFEDWMVAPGYYMCVFFWTLVFLLNDLMPERQTLRLRAASPAHPRFTAMPQPPFAFK
jgi:O-antigen ligase